MTAYRPRHARRPDPAELARKAPHLLPLADLITVIDDTEEN